MENRTEDEIDLLKLAAALWRKAWAIVLAVVLFATAALGYTAFFVTPLYEATALMYVNSSSISVGSTKVSISQGELSAAQSLVKTYIVILNTRSTLEEVIAQSGVPYTYEELSEMVSAESVNSTEVFGITVTSPDPTEAELLANTIAQILPERIASVVEGSSARIVDYAVAPSEKASPSLRKNTLIGALLGAVLSCGIIIVAELLDDKLQDADELAREYNIPVLTVVPDLLSRKGEKYYSYYDGHSRQESNAR